MYLSSGLVRPGPCFTCFIVSLDFSFSLRFIKMSSLVISTTFHAFKNGNIARLLKQCKHLVSTERYICQIRHNHVVAKSLNHHTKGAIFRKPICCCKSFENRVIGHAAVRFASTGVLEKVAEVTESSQDQGISTLISAHPQEAPRVTGNTPSVTKPLSSDASTTVQGSVIDAIPEPPAVPPEVVDVVQSVGEPTFASMGLGGWSPVGIVENCMEFLHIDCSLPWWLSIAIGTTVVRLVIFPLVIVSQRNAAKMNNNLPQLQIIQMKMTEARQTGNQLEAARYGQELMLFMKEKGLNPFKNMIVPLAQAPLFISFFMALRGMANVPVESMSTGGLFWFMDLTVPDQYFLLPIITSATLFLTIEIGTDSARLSASNMQMMKYFLRALPVFILPFTINFPGAVLCYWVSSNFISLLQVGFLKIPAVRDYFKIDPMIIHQADSLPVKPKGFVEGFRESWTNLKITKEMEERQRFDEIQFQKAGTGPIQKTYKYDPTRPRSAISAKERET